MIRTHIATVFSILLVFTGCSATPSIQNESNRTPKKAVSSFLNYITNEKYSKAYALLTEDTQKRYKQNHFWGMMTQTRAGTILRWKAQNAKISEVSRNGNSASVTLKLPDGPESRMVYEVVRSKNKNGNQTWKIRYFLADDLNLPRGDEQYLFDSRETSEKDEE